MGIDSKFYKWMVLTLLFLNVAFGFGTVSMIAPLSSEINQDIGLSMAAVGSALAFFTLASPIFSPIGGVLADKYGSRGALAVAGLVVSVASASRYFVTDSNQLIGLMFVAGAGFACFGPIIPKALSYAFSPKEFGKANGIAVSAFAAGTTLAFLFAASVLSPALGGWRATAVFYGVMSGAFALCWALFFRDEPAPESAAAVMPAQEGSTEGVFWKMLRNRDVLRISLFYVLWVAALFTMLSYLPRALEDRGMEQPGVLAALMTGTMIVFNILGGYIAARVGRKPVLAVGTIVFGCCIPLFLVVSGWPLFILLIVAGAAAGPIIPVATAMPVHLPTVGPALVGTALGIVYMVGNMGGFFGPLLAGRMIESSGSPWSGFLLASALAVGASLVLLKLPEPKIVREKK